MCRIKGVIHIKHCEICGSTSGKIKGKNGKYGMDLCYKHMYQMRYHGKILDITIFTPNQMEIKESVLEITLRDKNCNITAVAIVDRDKYEIVRHHKWVMDNRGYVVSKINGKQEKLHRLITNAPLGMVVDHISHNLLDNRLVNLRVCTNKENLRNRVTGVNNTSGCKGVCWSKHANMWMSYIKTNGKTIYLGYFKDINDAIFVRKEAEVKYHKDFAYKEVI